MRNRAASTIAFFIFYCASFASSGQFIHSKLNLYGGALVETFHGKPYVQEGNFSYPALMANFNKSIGYNVKILYRTRNHLSMGIQLEQRKASDWKLEGRETYTGATLTLNSLSPTVQYRTNFIKVGNASELKGIIELAPSFGTSQLSLINPLFDIQNGPQPPKESNSGFFGVTGSLGFEFEFSPIVGLAGSYSFQYCGISSALFAEDKFTSSRLLLSVYVKLMKDKRYFYFQ